MPDRAALLRLRQELSRDLDAARALLVDLTGRRDAIDAEPVAGDDRVLLGYVAVTLHQLYTALESAFERICRVTEGSLPTGADSHQALLADMALELPGLRPPVLSPEAMDALRPLLRFRHFVRHAYAIAWDRERIREVLDLAGDAWAIVEVDLRQFIDFLDAVAAELQPTSA